MRASLYLSLVLLAALASATMPASTRAANPATMVLAAPIPAAIPATIPTTTAPVAPSSAATLPAATLPVATAPAPARRQTLAWGRYHTVEEIDAWLEGLAARYPRLVTLLEIGRSRAGRRILAVEISNPDTGEAADKPAFYNDGNIHGGEVLGGEAALYLIQRLLEDYGQDHRITELVDRFVFYNVPIVNPDGRAASIDTPENHRWNIRPVDEDGDGRVDEDPPEDLDGDGRILQMRVVDPRGQWKADSRDPRSIVRRARGDREGLFYRVSSEGIDNDGDGAINEDGIGGVDLNRNFPANWHPAQLASGPFPLSEPESHALVAYITARPNIAAVHTFHTSGGLLLRFPTLADQDWDFPAADIELYGAIADDGAAITGYANYATDKQPIVDLMSPGHGVFNDWASSVFGVIAMTTEMWRHPMGDERALLAWNDEVLDGAGFVDWYPYEHPTLGAVELGGWDRWSVSNPPEHLIAGELERNVDWVLGFAEKLPRLALLDARALEVEGAPGLFAIQASVANVGWLPTATRYATEVMEIGAPVVVELQLENVELQWSAPREVLGVLPGTRGGEPRLHRLSWNAAIVDASRPASVEIVLRSQKAGAIRQRLELSPRR